MWGPGSIIALVVIGAGLLASLCAFSPSFAFVLAGGPHFDQIRSNRRVQSFLTGACSAAIGAIAGSAIPLGLAIDHLWQVPVLGGALVWLLILRRSVVLGLIGAAAVGVLAAFAGAPV